MPTEARRAPLFQRGDLVKIKKRAKTPENRQQIKENTYGTINSLFEVTYCDPPLEIQGEIRQASYWITPVGKTHSTVCMHENELFAARGKAAVPDDLPDDEGIVDMTLPDVPLD